MSAVLFAVRVCGLIIRRSKESGKGIKSVISKEKKMLKEIIHDWFGTEWSYFYKQRPSQQLWSMVVEMLWFSNVNALLHYKLGSSTSLGSKSWFKKKKWGLYGHIQYWQVDFEMVIHAEILNIKRSCIAESKMSAMQCQRYVQSYSKRPPEVIIYREGLPEPLR